MTLKEEIIDAFSLQSNQIEGTETELHIYPNSDNQLSEIASSFHKQKIQFHQVYNDTEGSEWFGKPRLEVANA